MSEKVFTVHWISEDQHWVIRNGDGMIVHRYQKSMSDYAHLMAQSLNWIGFRYAEEGMDFIDGFDPE